jgi:hypothetical protein
MPYNRRMRNDFLWSFMTLTAFTLVLSWAAYVFFGGIVNAEIEKPLTRVEVYDFIDTSTKTHRLSGIIMVPTRCHSINVKTKELEPGKYHVYFSSFGDVHGCADDPQPLSFREYVKAPIVGTEFTASLDWRPLDFVIVSKAHSRP